MAKMIIIEGNSNDKDNVRAYMVKGEKGNDGFSPVIESSREGKVTTLTITDAEGTQEVDINDGNGIVSIQKTGTSGNVDTYTITFDDGTTTTFTVTNGQGGGGDMTKAVYDTNDNGIVDNAEKVNNHTVECDIPSNLVTRVTTLETQMGDVSTLLDTINGEVI